MARKSICPICKQYVLETDDIKKYQNKKCHKPCLDNLIDLKDDTQGDKQKLTEYICKIFDIKEISNLIDNQINKYIKDLDYSYSGIYGSLYYFYDLKENQISEDINGIGIVPFVYEEAKSFFIQISKTNQENEDVVIENKSKKILMKAPNKNLKCSTKIENL